MLVRFMSLVAIFMLFAISEARADDVGLIKGKANCETIADPSKQQLCKALMIAASDDEDCEAFTDTTARLMCNAVSEASDEEDRHTQSMKYCERIATNDDKVLCFSAISAIISAASD